MLGPHLEGPEKNYKIKLSGVICTPVKSMYCQLTIGSPSYLLVILFDYILTVHTHANWPERHQKYSRVGHFQVSLSPLIMA